MEIWQRETIIIHTQRLLNSFKHWTERELLVRSGSAEEQSRSLFEAPIVLVSDGLEADAILNYGNAAALKLWEMDWERLTRTPSRATAEPGLQAERAKLMQEVSAHGFAEHYNAVRISGSGKRFRIEDTTVWVVLDEQGARVGKAAAFERWTWM